MKLHFAFAAVAMFQLSGCGILDRDNDESPSHRSTINPPSFALTGTETTTLDSPALRVAVSGFKILSKVDFAIKNATEIASTISRGKSKNFNACVKSKLNNTPLAVTNDTVSINFNFDFIAACDDAAKPDDLIGEIHNTMTGTLTIGCSDDKIADLAGKTAKDLPADICSGAQSMKISYNYVVDAKKTTLVKNGSDSEVTNIQSYVASTTLSAADGGPCVQTVTDTKVRHIDSCRIVSQSKSFNGAPKYENNSPVVSKDAHEKEPRPIVMQMTATVSNAEIDTDAPYYKSADTQFLINGWNGKVTYLNGWAAPTWEASKNSEKVTGSIGSTADTTSGSQNTNTNTNSNTSAGANNNSPQPVVVSAPQKPATDTTTPATYDPAPQTTDDKANGN